MGFYLDSLKEAPYENKNLLVESLWTQPQKEEYLNFIHEAQVKMLKEAYYGKIKEVQNIQKKISEIRQKYQTNQMKFNTSKDRNELEDLICETFGFKAVDITIEPSAVHNACTIPVYMEVFNFKDLRKYIISDGKGVKYTSAANACVMIKITKGLFFSSIYTDEEITALLLHEVGHSFQTAMNNRCRWFNMVEKVVNVLAFPIIWVKYPGLSPLRDNWYDFCRNVRKNFTLAADIYYTIGDCISTIAEIFGCGLGIIRNVFSLFTPLVAFRTLPDKIISKFNSVNGIASVIYLPGDFMGETFADQFVTSYGYGADFASALRKKRDCCSGMTNEAIFRSIPILNAYFDFINIPDKILSTIFDPHPENISRINSQIKSLQYEIDNDTNMSPKIKREIKSQITKIEKEMDQFSSLNNTNFIVSNALDKLFLMCFGGDWRNFMASGTPESFEAAQERAEEQLRSMKKR